MTLHELQYPIGEYIPNKNPEDKILTKWINDIESFPSSLVEITNGLSVENLNWKYRPNGWSVKQVIHHCADSHMNSIIRFKLALTEDAPTIRPYYENRWAELSDSLDNNLSDSLTLLKGLHKKWTLLLKGLTQEELQLEFIHPEHGQRFNLAENIGNYAWHCNHHLAHVQNGITSNGKYN